jgi:hypothetical protein
LNITNGDQLWSRNGNRGKEVIFVVFYFVFDGTSILSQDFATY